MNIHLAALPGQFHVTPDVDHPGNPFGVTFHTGDTHRATLCGFCLLTSFPVSEHGSWELAHDSLGSRKTKLQHLALCPHHVSRIMIGYLEAVNSQYYQ